MAIKQHILFKYVAISPNVASIHILEYDRCLITGASSSAAADTGVFLHDGCHVIEYLFTDVYYRRSGYGAQVLAAMQQYCLSQVFPVHNHSTRTVLEGDRDVL